MSIARKIGMVVLGPVLGGGLGFLGGLAYTELAHTSGFQGYSGFVVVYWMLTGAILGLVAGFIFAVRS